MRQTQQRTAFGPAFDVVLVEVADCVIQSLELFTFCAAEPFHLTDVSVKVVEYAHLPALGNSIIMDRHLWNGFVGQPASSSRRRPVVKPF